MCWMFYEGSVSNIQTDIWISGYFLVTGSQASDGEGGDGDGEAENITNWHNCGLGMQMEPDSQ